MLLDDPAPPQQTGVPTPGGADWWRHHARPCRDRPTQTTREDRVVENGWYESVSLSDYVGVVWRRKWIALLVTVMVTAAAIGFSERQQKLFAATSQLVNTSSPTQPSSGKNSPRQPWSTTHAPLFDTLRAANYVVVKSAGLTGITGSAAPERDDGRAPIRAVDAIDFTVTDHERAHRPEARERVGAARRTATRTCWTSARSRSRAQRSCRAQLDAGQHARSRRPCATTRAASPRARWPTRSRRRRS